MNRNQANVKSGDRFTQPIPLICVLHSGQLYGTERMTINLARSLLSHEYFSIIIATGQSVIAEATRYNITAYFIRHICDLVCCFNDYLVKYPKLVFVTTSISQSILIMLCNLFYHRQIVHLHIVHGGAEEYLSYARKSLLNYLPVKLIAVSDFVRDRLLVHGVKPDKIKVIENFLITSQISEIPQRPNFIEPGIQKILIVSRIDPIKRIDLLFETLDFAPQLNNLSFRIFGFGRDFHRLKKKLKLNILRLCFMVLPTKYWQKWQNQIYYSIFAQPNPLVWQFWKRWLWGYQF